MRKALFSFLITSASILTAKAQEKNPTLEDIIKMSAQQTKDSATLGNTHIFTTSMFQELSQHYHVDSLSQNFLKLTDTRSPKKAQEITDFSLLYNKDGQAILLRIKEHNKRCLCDNVYDITENNLIKLTEDNVILIKLARQALLNLTP